MTYNLLACDIETKPNYALVRELNEFIPKQTTFDPSKVATGNWGPEKSAAKIEKARADFAGERETEEADFWAALDDRAALHPLTSSIVAIGFMDDNGPELWSYDERMLLEIFWEKYMALKKGSRNTPHKNIVGWNLLGFDLPRIMQRSQILGIPVPGTVLPDRYYDKIFIDLLPKFCCYQYGQNKGLSLENVAKVMGVAQPRKHGIKGKDFWKHLEKDKEKALIYLSDDLTETYAVGQRILNNV